MYKNIVIPVSFDDDRDIGRAVDIARALASDGARFTFIHVLETIPAYVLEAIPNEVLDRRGDAAKEKLGDLVGTVKNGHAVVLNGGAGRAIVDWCHENDADCIVIASHRPVVSDFILGSTAAWVVRHAACSVHVIH